MILNMSILKKMILLLHITLNRPTFYQYTDLISLGLLYVLLLFLGRSHGTSQDIFHLKIKRKNKSIIFCIKKINKRWSF